MPIYPALDVRVPQLGKAAQLREKVIRGRKQDERADAAAALNQRKLDIDEQRFTQEKTMWAGELEKQSVSLDKAKVDLGAAGRKATTFDMRALQDVKPNQASIEAYNAAHPENPTTLKDLARDQAQSDSWMAGIKPDKASTVTATPIVYAFKGPKGVTYETINPENRKKLADANARGGRPIKLSATASTPEGLMGELTPPQKGKALIAEVKRKENQLTLTNLLGTLTSSAVGIRGAAIESLGGVLGQVPIIGEDLERSIEDLFDGDLEKIRAFRLKAKLLGASMIGEIVGEESGRVSDSERAVSNEAVAALELAKNFRQVRTNLLTLNTVSMRKSYRYAILKKGMKPQFDLATDEGVEKAGADIMKMGYTFEETRDVLKQLAETRNMFSDMTL